MTLPARTYSGEPLAHAARLARLDLSPERLAKIGPTVEGIYALIDTLDAVPLGETPPATAFDASWEH